DPYRGEPWARIPRAGRADVDRAVAAAKRAMWDGPWATMTASARGKVLRRIGDLVEREARALAEVEVRDNGKLFAEMYGQTRYQPEWWWYYAGLADKVEGETDKTERDALIKEGFDVLNADWGYIPLHQQALAWGVSKKVHLTQRADNLLLLYWVSKDPQ
ncbi:aldehyde dehydrogenase family protein, partial [Citrobacter sp. VF227]